MFDFREAGCSRWLRQSLDKEIIQMNQDLVIPENYIIVAPDDRLSGAYSSIELNENITPQDYLKFAIQDFNSGQGDRSNVNAFANAKRAIHLQTDIISKAFGIDRLPEKHRDSFPKKISFCEKCGIVGGRILTKLNKIRNKIEHEYYLPQNDEVENIIDVVELFLAATARFISLFPSDIEVELKPQEGRNIPSVAGIGFPVNEGIIYLFPDIKEADKSKISFDNFVQWQKDNSVNFTAIQGEHYFKWVNFLVSHTL